MPLSCDSGGKGLRMLAGGVKGKRAGRIRTGTGGATGEFLLKGLFKGGNNGDNGVVVGKASAKSYGEDGEGGCRAEKL